MRRAHCSVVVYLLTAAFACSNLISPLAGSKIMALPWYCSALIFEQQSRTSVFLRKSLVDCSPRSTALYFSKVCVCTGSH